ncbi:MAG TPA: hypothetical protein VD971_03765 [Phycisphaerales bacterium]|nr:hypothetical protein [Phycisphaerales bacterium]
MITSCRFGLVVTAIVLSSAAGAWAQPGRIVAVGDEWTISNSAFDAHPGSAAQLVSNMGDFLTGGAASDIAIFSNHPRISGSQSTDYRSTLVGDGHSLTLNPAAGYSLATLQSYDVVIIGGRLNGNVAPDPSVLTAYVAGGGNVLLLTGTGTYGDAFGENAQWDPFLVNYGLRLSTDFFPSTSNVVVPFDATPHPVGTGVSALLWGFGQNVMETNPADPFTDVLTADFSGFPNRGHETIIGTFMVPAPGGVMFAAACCTLAGRRRRTKGGVLEPAPR